MALLTRKNLSELTSSDALRIIVAYLGDWPYTRAVDQVLLAHWQTLEQFQPWNIWIAYDAGEPVAFVHGQCMKDRKWTIHLLAMMPGQAKAASWLLREMENDARKQNIDKVVGPHWRTAVFYGGYILGCEPYHPHWAADGTEAYVRAGFHISLAAVIMVRELDGLVPIDECHADYQIVPSPPRQEFGAIPFGYCALHKGEKVAHCYARIFENLKSPSGGIVGQIGNVLTGEAHRGRRLARVMTQMCLRDMQVMGAREALIATAFDNAPALRAYENVGFERRYNINEWSKDIIV